ncbi:hypothetical protein [Acidisphaera sp. L21]|jgi:hypothetical protein|uniref:hypothetical protein n=1 Tax=Acidisphaera sp. L21 TaxID=1641851 RepID=UPI00131DBE3C|nr:hypothetical protein [Acidisphaera sp. L21]
MTMAPDDGAPSDLSHAGAIVDKAIEYMVGQNISSLSIASALLGGSLGLLTRSLSDEAVVQILTNAIGSVQSGEMRGLREADVPRN